MASTGDDGIGSFLDEMVIADCRTRNDDFSGRQLPPARSPGPAQRAAAPNPNRPRAAAPPSACAPAWARPSASVPIKRSPSPSALRFAQSDAAPCPSAQPPPPPLSPPRRARGPARRRRFGRRRRASDVACDPPPLIRPLPHCLGDPKTAPTPPDIRRRSPTTTTASRTSSTPRDRRGESAAASPCFPSTRGEVWTTGAPSRVCAGDAPPCPDVTGDLGPPWTRGPAGLARCTTPWTESTGVCCNLSKWYVDDGAVSTRLWFVVALLKFAKDRFVERQPRTTAQSTGLIMVDLVKYYAVFPVLPAFMEWGRKGYFQTQRSKTVMTAVLTVRSGLDPHMIREMDGWTWM
ncbi:hypothetical protein EJB05_05314, partial [Eragrostis curvula]